MRNEETKAWEAFSQTGAVGAYLTYRAMRSRQGLDAVPRKAYE